MTSTASTASTDNEHRLPRSASPRRYNLVIAPDLEEASFSGSVDIDLDIHEPVSEVLLNAAELQVSTALLSPAVGGPPDGGHGQKAAAATAASTTATAAMVSLDAEAERLTVAFPGPIAPGSWQLHLDFSGAINDKLAGFYRSRFTGSDGAPHTLGVTQFEATDARRAFPCWDEPDRKAVFSLTLELPPGITAVSNTALASESEGPNGRRTLRFADTITMSTYLVAWVVGPLQATEPLDVGGVPLRVVHVPGKEHLTAFALEVGAHALAFFTDWFGIAYPGDKLDLIAVPDFAFGAMENLGAVTFRETLLLLDPAAAARVEMERAADVICHEIAHMWFGDLVTMRWWNGLWLNEAFATYMEILAVDAFRPEWQRWGSFASARAAAFATDGLSCTRPIEYPVTRPADAEGMFDVLTYEKGASVLRMLERYLGTPGFQAGIRRYLGAHAHANAETTDLWDAIETASGEPARATMDTWIFQGGHPLVSVSAEGTEVRLTQQPFRYREVHPAGPAPGDSIGADWQVPVLLRIGVIGRGEPNTTIHSRKVLLGPAGATVEAPGEIAWVVANAGGSGFYRVRTLGEANPPLANLDAVERFNCVSDTWATTRAGLVGLSECVRLLRMVVEDGEADPDVWGVVVSILGALDLAVSKADRPAVQAFVRELVRPTFARVGWRAARGEDERGGKLRATLLATLGTIGADPEVRARATSLHAKALAGGPSIDPDLAGAVVGVVAAVGGADAYESFLDRWRHPANPQEELRYMYGLAGFEEPELVARTLAASLGDIRTQDAPYMLNRLLTNRPGGPAAWAFVREHWDELCARFPDNTIPRMLSGLSSLVDPELAAQVHAFFAEHPLHSGQRSLDQTLERLDINVAFAEREGPHLVQALQ